MKYELTCLYCGKEWQELFFSKKRPKCPICGDSNIKASKVDDERGNKFGYPEDSKIEDDDLPFWGMEGD